MELSWTMSVEVWIGFNWTKRGRILVWVPVGYPTERVPVDVVGGFSVGPKERPRYVVGLPGLYLR